MKVPRSRGDDMLRGERREPNMERKPRLRTKRAHFSTLVARHYAAVYRLASRLTDDPLEAVLLTHDAFNSTRKLLRSGHEEVAVVTILLTAVTHAGLTAP
jgi:DNA-directed RNA polymerase specialized sigma24 family protein